MMTATPAQVQQRALRRRAVEAAIWGMPAVNYDAMYQALVRTRTAVPTRSCIGLGYWTGRTRH